MSTELLIVLLGVMIFAVNVVIGRAALLELRNLAAVKWVETPEGELINLHYLAKFEVKLSKGEDCYYTIFILTSDGRKAEITEPTFNTMREALDWIKYTIAGVNKEQGGEK